MYESISAQMNVFLVLFTIFAFYDEFFKPKLQKKIVYQKYVHLGENTPIHISQRTVVHVHVNVFFKFTQHARVTQTESNQEVTKND